jgi:hypothetical protein
LLAIYLHHGRSLPDGHDVLVLDDTLWPGFTSKQEYRARKEADQVSYAWDSVIEFRAQPLFQRFAPPPKVESRQSHKCHRPFVCTGLNRKTSRRLTISLARLRAPGRVQFFDESSLLCERERVRRRTCRLLLSPGPALDRSGPPDPDADPRLHVRDPLGESALPRGAGEPRLSLVL